jgi:hypothetical protein
MPGDHLDRYGVFVWYAYAMQRAYAMHAGRAQQNHASRRIPDFETIISDRETNFSVL